MCDDYGSDSGGFDDVGSSDFDSDIGSDFDSDVSSDFDTDYSSDIDSMDFDDVETIDFDDDTGSDFDTSDFSDDIDSMDFDDVESIDFDDAIGDDFDTDIEAMDFDEDIETLDIDDDIDTLDIDDDIETLDIDDDIETLDIDDDIETIDIEDDIETLDIDDDIETLDIDDNIEELDIDDDIETLDIDDSIEELDIDDDIETIDLEDDVEASEFNEDVEDIDIDDISEEDFDVEEGFDNSEMDITDEESEIEADLSEMEEMAEDMEDIESLEFDDEGEITDDIETLDLDDETEASDIDDVESIDIDDDIEDIDISEDIENMDLDDIVEGEDITEATDDGVADIDDGSLDELEDIAIDSEVDDATADGEEPTLLNDILTNHETWDSYPGDIPTYTDANENTSPEAIDWDSMLSDGDRDYINDVMNNGTYTQEQKDFLINEYLGEVYERETAEPEYGARVKGLTYDGRDMYTKPPEDVFDGNPYDNELFNEVLNNENLSPEHMRYLSDSIQAIADDDSLSPEEKSFQINEMLDFAANYTAPASTDGVNEFTMPTETSESIDEGIVNEYNEPFSGELSEQDIDTVYEGLNEYDFHGVDCLQDTGRLDSSLENFTSENWENLSLDEQKEQMTDLAQYIIDVTGLENPPKIEFYNSGKDGDYGGFNRATNTLSINEHMLYQNDEAADTVAHELWHAYQYERASNPSTKLDYMYLENFNDYITPDDDFEGYQSQVLESEARAFAQQIKDRLNSY